MLNRNEERNGPEQSTWWIFLDCLKMWRMNTNFNASNNTNADWIRTSMPLGQVLITQDSLSFFAKTYEWKSKYTAVDSSLS